MSRDCLQRTNNELQANVSQLTVERDNAQQHIWVLEGQMHHLNQTHSVEQKHIWELEAQVRTLTDECDDEKQYAERIEDELRDIKSAHIKHLLDVKTTNPTTPLKDAPSPQPLTTGQSPTPSSASDTVMDATPRTAAKTSVAGSSTKPGAAAGGRVASKSGKASTPPVEEEEDGESLEGEWTGGVTKAAGRETNRRLHRLHNTVRLPTRGTAAIVNTSMR
mmetsp:Transcript_36034/g.90729  ORF Transcript_36034/g.90729 Transcript_36034/m.90729 type:complete len:220 (+) Transcript_36034:1211-1870(+)